MVHDLDSGSSEETASAISSDRNLYQLLRDAVQHFQSGRLNQARTELEDIRQRYPKSAEASHYLGLVAHQLGDDARAFELLEEAVELNRVVPLFHGNLGEVYRAAGRFDDAIASCRKATELYPVYPEALNTLGASLYELKQLEEAEEILCRAIEFKPNLAVAHANYGNLLRSTGRLKLAVKSYDLAIRHNPKLTGAYLALGGTLQAMGRLTGSVQIYRRGLDVDSNDAKLWSGLGTTLRHQGKTEEALECLRKAVELEPKVADLHTNLGTALLVLGRMEEAVQCYAAALSLKRRPEWHLEAKDREPLSQDPNFRFTTTPKVRHDVEQYHYLMELGRIPDSFRGEIARYEDLLREVESSDGRRIALSSAQREKIFGSYNKLVHVAEAPALEGGALNPELDFEAIQSHYFENAPGVTYFDNLLNQDALSSLRAFCLESTIWFETKVGGYLGAYLSEGFYCGLLFQIGEELRQRFPRIFAGHKLRQMWAYKYDSQLSGIELHADAAAVNVNFWVTPDEANLQPDSGGLEVYLREAPREWNFEKYNRDQEALQAFIADSDGRAIPYRQNRAVMFNSNLVHRTDAFQFKEGYENRRINITMLFGQRGQAPKA